MKARTMSQSNPNEILIAALGASAGGLEALEKFFNHMPADAGIGFIVVQHLAPDHPSALVQLLSRHTKMKVEQAKDSTEVVPNRIYIIPPNATLTIKNNHLQVTSPDQARGHRTPIDALFRSLAEDQGENAVCIMLSGTGTDGTLGLAAIKEYGGMAMAQSLETAKYDAILRSAIGTGLVDHILPVEEMPAKLLEYASHLNLTNGKADGLREQIVAHINRIHFLLRRRAGHDFSQYKQSTITRRVQRRMKALQIESIEQYLQTLESQPDEVDRLFKDLLIGVTQFFRDPEAFEALAREVIPKLFEGKAAGAQVRACVVGCATGEEAYTLAILLSEHAATLQDPPAIKIFATDIDERGLEMARRGRYPESIAEHVSEERLQRFFAKQDGAYRVNRELRELCLFTNHSFIKDPPFSRLNLISCRNVMIYLASDLQRKIIPLFHYALRADGYLFLGPSESASSHPAMFRTIDKKHRIYQRREGQAHGTPIFPLANGKGFKQTNRNQPIAQDEKLRQFERIILQKYRPACVVVQENGDVEYFSGQTGRYLEPAIGSPSSNVINMAREGLRIPLRTALHQAVTTRERVVQKQVSIQTDGRENYIDLTVEPMPQFQAANLFMIVFEDAVTLAQQTVHPPHVSADGSEETIRHLEGELRAAQEYAQSAFEELETSNEELQSANEEYQSTNEELETSKEELQSFNEELETVNGELNRKVTELDHINGDLQNLLNSTQIATIFLDRELRIRSFTPAAGSVFRLIPGDMGRPLTDLAAQLANLDLLTEAQAVLKDLVPRTRHLTGPTGKHFQMQVLPYRSVRDVIDGVVITFTDVTQLTQAEQVSRDAQIYAQNIVETIREPLLILDADLRIKSANRSFYTSFQVRADSTLNQLVYDLGNKQWDIPELRRLLNEVLPQEKSLEDYEVEHEFPNLGKRTMLLNAREVSQQNAGARLILLAIEDITERKSREFSRTKEELQSLSEKLMKTQEDQLRRIARDLHDDLAQQLSIMEMDLQSLRNAPPADSQEVARRLEPIIHRMGALSNEVSALSHQLHPTVLEDLGLEMALRNLVEEFERVHHLTVHLSTDLDQPIPPPVATALYRIAQEALRNITKHAPGSQITILASQTPDTMRLLVEDTGPGFDVKAMRRKGGLGIVSMRERARQIGGVVEIRSRPGAGTQITVIVPLHE